MRWEGSRPRRLDSLLISQKLLSGAMGQQRLVVCQVEAIQELVDAQARLV